MLNLNQPLRGTTRPHITGKEKSAQGKATIGYKKSESLDMTAAKIVNLFSPYLRPMSDTEFLSLFQKLAALLSASFNTPIIGRKKK